MARKKVVRTSEHWFGTYKEANEYRIIHWAGSSEEEVAELERRSATPVLSFVPGIPPGFSKNHEVLGMIGMGNSVDASDMYRACYGAYIAYVYVAEKDESVHTFVTELRSIDDLRGAVADGAIANNSDGAEVRLIFVFRNEGGIYTKAEDVYFRLSEFPVICVDSTKTDFFVENDPEALEECDRNGLEIVGDKDCPFILIQIGTTYTRAEYRETRSAMMGFFNPSQIPVFIRKRDWEEKGKREDKREHEKAIREATDPGYDFFLSPSDTDVIYVADKIKESARAEKSTSGFSLGQSWTSGHAYCPSPITNESRSEYHAVEATKNLVWTSLKTGGLKSEVFLTWEKTDEFRNFSQAVAQSCRWVDKKNWRIGATKKVRNIFGDPTSLALIPKSVIMELAFLYRQAN